MCNGTLYRYQVHYEDRLPKLQRPLKGWTNTALPANAAQIRNMIHVSNHLMSHILHFYHLAALDYVKPVVNVGGNYVDLKRPFLCPRYDDAYYINHLRVWAAAPNIPNAPLMLLVNLFNGGVVPNLGNPNDPGWANIANGINNYLVGQYLKALNIRRICHEMQAIFSGRAPQVSGWTPGGATASVTQADINKARELLYEGGVGGTPNAPAPGTIMQFIGEPSDFLTATPFTMMFDVVAAAHLFPEYFWIGNSWNQYIAWGWGEETGNCPLSGFLGGIFGSINNTDQRASRRGYKLNALPGAPNNVDIMKIGECVASSHYNAYAGYRHPWKGLTGPNVANGYSWLKSPRYNHGTNLAPDWRVFEVGPLARMVVNGTYWAGILKLFYPICPAPPPDPSAAGPDIAGGTNPLGAALLPVYAAIPGVAGGPNLSGVAYNGDSVLDRIAARALEARIMADLAVHYLNKLELTIIGGYGSSGCTDPAGLPQPNPPHAGPVKKGYGMTEASRGALSHWIKARKTADGKDRITGYQAVVPTTWNASPRDCGNLGNGVNPQPGPAEQSLMSNGGLWIANPSEPIEVIRVTHSYDFCIACAVHLITPEGDTVKVDIPAMPG